MRIVWALNQSHLVIGSICVERVPLTWFFRRSKYSILFFLFCGGGDNNNDGYKMPTVIMKLDFRYPKTAHSSVRHLKSFVQTFEYCWLVYFAPKMPSVAVHSVDFVNPVSIFNFIVDSINKTLDLFMNNGTKIRGCVSFEKICITNKYK